MPEKTQHWTDSLFDSVYALYETAREYQTAHRSAQLTSTQVDFDRRRSHEGRIALEGHSARAGADRPLLREPHPDALFALIRLYQEAESEMHRRYEEAALLYASGAVWAVRAIQLGHTPPLVAFQTDQYDNPVQHRLSLTGLTGLTNYAGAPALGRAYEQLARRLASADHAVHLSEQGNLADHEAGELYDAHDDAMGIADAAFAYGLLAQRSLNWALLEPRRARETELALARAAAQNDQPTQ
ncbi:hypothetical protein ABZ351_18335 [Streptomyces microflavus]|uniref:hypothetical protein n=1 Tax=Streptomyces microflavus TaxID=1919 RepID=UPI0033EFAB85